MTEIRLAEDNYNTDIMILKNNSDHEKVYFREKPQKNIKNLNLDGNRETLSEEHIVLTRDLFLVKDNLALNYKEV